MAPSIIGNDVIQGEVFLPGQIFVFCGFVLRANSLGHLEHIDSYAPGHQVRFGNSNYTTDIRGGSIFDGFEPMSGTLHNHDEHDLALWSDSVDHTCNYSGPQSGTNCAICGRVDGPRHGGRTHGGDSAEY